MRGSIYSVLLVWGRFCVSETIIPESQEHFLTSSARRDTHLFGGSGLSPDPPANNPDALEFAMLRTLKTIPPRLTPSLGIIAFCFVVVIVLAWVFGLPDDVFPRIMLSLLAALMPVLEFSSPPRQWRTRGPLLWFAAFLMAVLLLVASDKFDVDVLGTNSAIVLISLPLWWLAWLLMGRRWLLSAGLILALVVMMIYWIAALAQDDSPLELFLLPLPTIILVGAIWAPVAWLILVHAQRLKRRRISGPGMQALAMDILFLPVIVVAMVVPSMLGLCGDWSTISLTLVSFLMSTVISAPLRRFLLEWGNLNPNPPMDTD